MAKDLLECGETRRHTDFHGGSKCEERCESEARADSDADLQRKARVLYRFVYLNNVYAGVQVDGSFSLFAVLLILVGV